MSAEDGDGAVDGTVSYQQIQTRKVRKPRAATRYMLIELPKDGDVESDRKIHFDGKAKSEKEVWDMLPALLTEDGEYRMVLASVREERPIVSRSTRVVETAKRAAK